MSCIRRNGVKTLLPRNGPDAFWDAVEEQFDPDDARAWRYLAMLALRETAGWSLERIGRAFGHPKGHVTRCLERIKDDLRHRCAPPDPRASPIDRTPSRNEP
jgi:hypothetical protein